ncbi:MAG: ISKra4 family transposase, partial [Chlorobiales bacterium]|nr:ISKra4 family transposase [Chlorobiales bacterium]
MKFKIQLVAQHETGEDTLELACLERKNEGLESIGITLAEAKSLLVTLQKQVVEHQLAAYLAVQRKCPQCDQAFRHKDKHPIVFRTLFGNLKLFSPRWFQCPCQSHKTRTFSPLAALLTEHCSPERLYLETKWASLISFDLASQLLKDVLPTDSHICATSVRNHLQRVAKRAEAELGEEQFSFIDGCQREWAALPRSSAPLTVGIDGGYVRKWDDKKTHFEVIVGKSIPEEGAGKCFGLVQSYDDKPKRRLFAVLKGQGMQPNQQITFFSDGGDTVRNLQLYLNPEAEHLLDWFHVTMRLTVLNQTAKGLPMTFSDDEQKTYQLKEPTLKAIESIKWYLWHGNTYEALEHLDTLEMELDAAAMENKDSVAHKLLRAVEEFHTYITNNQAF